MFRHVFLFLVCLLHLIRYLNNTKIYDSRLNVSDCRSTEALVDILLSDLNFMKHKIRPRVTINNGIILCLYNCTTIKQLFCKNKVGKIPIT